MESMESMDLLNWLLKWTKQFWGESQGAYTKLGKFKVNFKVKYTI